MRAKNKNRVVMLKTISEREIYDRKIIWRRSWPRGSGADHFKRP